MYKCHRCEVNFIDGVQCTVCLNRYDFPCAGITETGYRKLGDRRSTWRCGACKNSSTNVSPTPPKNPEMENILRELKYVSAQMSSMPALTESVKKVQEELSELKAFKDELSNLKSSFDHAFSSLTNKLARLEEEVHSLQSAKATIFTLEQRLAQFESKLNEEDQRSRLNNIEIKGVPVTASENLFVYIDRIGEILKCKIPKEQINYIMRVPTRKDNNSKNIIVSVHNRYLKENFVAAARSCKQLAASDLGLTGGNKIFINDHLTFHNKNLLNKTKKLAKETGFLFTWVRGCKIFARRNASSPVMTIKSESDLKKLSL